MMKSDQLKKWMLDALQNRAAIKNLFRHLYHAAEDFIDGDVLRKNAALKNAYANQRCFIICSGVSLNEIDLDALKDEHTFVTGNMHCPELHVRYQKRSLNTLSEKFQVPQDWSITFFAALDTVWEFLRPKDFVDVHIEFWRLANSVYTDPDTIFFVNGADRGFFERHGLLKGRRVHFVKTHLPMAHASVQTNDLTKRITFFDGSIFFMIAASIYMGFKELYLCGCDYTYQPRRSGHVYENWTELDDKPVDERHQITKNFAEAHGVRIYNITPDGFASPVYEKISWQEVIHNVLRAPVAHMTASLRRKEQLVDSKTLVAF